MPRSNPTAWSFPSRCAERRHHAVPRHDRQQGHRAPEFGGEPCASILTAPLAGTESNGVPSINGNAAADRESMVRDIGAKWAAYVLRPDH
jgi:hypothetical protein